MHVPRPSPVDVARDRRASSRPRAPVLGLCALVLVGIAPATGCRSTIPLRSLPPDAHRAATVPESQNPTASSVSPVTSLGLEPGRFHTAPEYEDASKRLDAALRRAFPGMHVSLDWTPERLHICVQDVPYDVLTTPGTKGRPSMLLQIALLLPPSSDPPTQDLWISAKRADGQFVQERDTWDGWVRLDEHRRALLAGKESEQPPHGLARNLVSGDRDHAPAAQALFEELTRQYPAVEFSVAWTTECLHVTTENVTFERSMQVLYPDKADPQSRSLWLGILVSAATSAAPPTRDLWVSARKQNGGWAQERWPWEILMRTYGR